MNTVSAGEAEREVGPLLRIVRGEPSTEELAALLAAVAAYAAPAGRAGQPVAGSPWSDPAAALRRPMALGPHAWTSSGWQSGVRTRATW